MSHACEVVKHDSSFLWFPAVADLPLVLLLANYVNELYQITIQIWGILCNSLIDLPSKQSFSEHVAFRHAPAGQLGLDGGSMRVLCKHITRSLGALGDAANKPPTCGGNRQL